MENDFIIRHYLPQMDLSPLVCMLAETELIDHDGEDTSEEYLRASLTWENYRPAQDVWVAKWEGKLVGYGVALEQPSQFCTVYVVVHPARRRRGLGSQLLQLTLNRARNLGSKRILVYANEKNRGSNLFLVHQNFQHVASSGTMQLMNATENIAIEFPKGFTLKRYSEINDPLLLLKALNVCYLGMWGHWQRENHTEEERQSPRFLKYYDPDDLLLLFDEKDLLCGFCSLKPQGKQDANGQICDQLDGPGVIQEYRHLGYQRQLIHAGILHLRQKGTYPIILEFYGDYERTLNIYREIGFEMVNHYLAYHKELE